MEFAEFLAPFDTGTFRSQVFGQPVELFLCGLKPGTHIPPHFGIANNRLTICTPGAKAISSPSPTASSRRPGTARATGPVVNSDAAVC